MKNKGTQNEEIRCINKKTGKVKYFRRWFAFDKNWQKNTGFMPEELPKVVTLDQIPSKVESVKVTYEQDLTVKEAGETSDFDESLITNESDNLRPEEIKETPTAKPKGKKADKTTHK